MATLRSTGPLFRQGTVTTEDLDNLRASGMSNLRRGVESGIMGNDITGMAADEASLRADNRGPAADSLRQQINALQQRQGAYALDVQDVTKVDSVGSGLDWFSGAVGQGVASMAEPMAAATGLTAAGNVVGMLPGAGKLVGAGLRLAGPLAAYGINARHLKGEVYNDMVQDPTIMANHTAQELNTKANWYGGIAGLADTALPAVIGNKLGGSGFGKGLLKNGGMRALGELGMEGATETAQGYGSAALRNQLNPNVEHNDWNERINDFAGGAAGAGPFTAAGHFADSAFRRTGDGVDRVTEAAGNVKDLMDESGVTGAAKSAGKAGVGFMKGMFSKAKKDVTDLAGDEDGNITVDSVKGAFRDATSGMMPSKDGVSKEDQSILRGDVPEHLHGNLDSPEFDDWARQNHEDRSNTVFNHLERMVQAGDPTATKLFDEMNNAMDANAQDAVVKRAADHILKHSELEGQLTAAENFGKIAGFAGKKGGEALAVAGKGAFNFAKSVWSGMQEGVKKNEQSWSAEDVAAHQDTSKKAAGNYIQQQAAMKKSRDRAELMGEYLAAMAQAEKPRYSANRAGAEHMPAFMKNIGYEIADLADSWNLGGEKGGTQGAKQPSGPSTRVGNVDDKRGQQFPGLKLNLNRIVSSMRTAYGDQKAADAISQLQSMLPDARVAPLFDAMQAELQTQSGPQGPQSTKEIRDAGAQEVLSKLPQEKEAALMREGISLRTPEGREILLGLVEKIATGNAPREAHVAMQHMVGRDVLNAMLGVVNRHFAISEAQQETTQTVDDRAMDDDAADGYTLDENGDPTEISTSDFDKNQAERKVTKGIGPKVYGFHAEKNMRTGSSNRNPFAGTTRVSKEDMLKWRTENSQRMADGEDLVADPRGIPNLFKKGQKLSEAMGGGPAVEQKIATMSKALKVDQTPENARRMLEEEGNSPAVAALDKLIAKAKGGDEASQAKLNEGMKAFFENRAGGWAFETKTAHDVMEDMKMQPGRRLALFREYLVRDGKNNQAKQVGQVLLDMIDARNGKNADKTQPRTAFRTDPGTRKRVMAAMNEYFKQHEIVVGQQLSDRDPSRITEPEVLDMARQGDKVIDLARRPDNLDRANQMISDANILTFKSDLSPHKDKTLNIPVGALVFWVKQQRALMAKMGLEDEQNYSNKSQNTDYLNAVLEGIGMLTASGMVEGFPYKLNADGRRESFSQGIPPSLMLATTNFAGLKFGEGKKQKKAAVTEGVTQHSDLYVFSQANPEMSKAEVQALIASIKEEKGTKGYQTALRKAMRKAGIKSDDTGHDKVGADQRRGAEPFVVDDSPAESEHMSGVIQANGEQYSADRFNPHYREESDNKTPLDNFPKQKDGEQRDDFADVLGRTKEGGESVYSMRASDLGKERGIDAAQKAPERAAPIVEALNKNYGEGLKMIQQRIKVASTASFSTNKNAAVGGMHYALPVAAALSSDNMATMDLGPVEAKELQELRRKVAEMFSSKDVYAKLRTDAAKLLAPDEKVTTVNALRTLNKIANEGKEEVAAEQSGKPQQSPQNGVKADLWTDPERKLNAQVAQGLADSREIMNLLGFKKAPARFAEVAGKLLTDPNQDVAKFVAQSAEALSHLLMEGKDGQQIRAILGHDTWWTERSKIAARLISQGMDRGDALVASYREIVRMALASELAARTQAEKTVLGQLMQMVRGFMSRFKNVLGAAEFADVVREKLNALIDKAHDPIDLKANYKKVSFQEAVDGDPVAADVLAHMATNKNIALTGSIVLADGGTIYRDAKNMLHDLDMIVRGTKADAEAHLRKGFPDAVQVYDFTTSNGKVDSYLVPPKGATIANIQREFGEKGRVLSFDVMQDGKVIGRTWNDGNGEHKSGISGTFVDLFTNTNEDPVKTIPFTHNGKNLSIASMNPAAIFHAKLLMGRTKDLNDYLHYNPAAGTRFNQQRGDGQGNGMPASQAQMDEAKAYVQKVLGKEIRVAFEKAMGHSGEWVDVENLIRISTTAAAGQLETAYHESLHAFFSKYVKNDPHMFAVMRTIAEDQSIVERLHALLDGFPAAQAQVMQHGEERLAYAYQFWAAGKLDLPGGKPKTFFAKLRQVFKRILGMVTDSDRATAMFEAFHDGKLSDPSAAGRVIAAELAKGTWTKNQLQKMDGLVQWVAGKTMASETVLTSSVSARAQALARELYSNPADEKGAKEEGYINARSRHAKQYSNLFKNIVRDLSDRDLTDVGEHMMKQTELADIPYQPVRKAVMQTRQLNQRFYRYMTDERGMKLGDLGSKYYPRVWSKSALIQGQQAFVDMLKQHYSGVLQEGVESSKGKLSQDDVALRIHQAILNGGEVMQKVGPQRDDGVLAPYFMSNRMRQLAWLDTAHSAPFQDKNFVKTMTTYYHDGARAAEYTSRFGEKGEYLDDAMREIRNELNEHSLNKLTKKEFKDEAARKAWVKAQMRDVRDAVSAMEGTIGKNISNKWRLVNSWVTAYQNVRLLPLMLFSSMVDPMALIGRGAPMKEAYEAYLRGMKEVFQNWGDMFRDEPKKRTADKWELLAEASGVVDVALFTHHVSDEYSSVFMDGKAKKINDMLFKANGMEAWDRGMRIAATKSAAMFIARHKSLPDAAHSARWLAELGLTPAEIHLDERGELITDKNDLADTLGITKEDAERQVDKLNYALARWVQGAVLSPNAAHRPAWGSDPHYSMFFHLKQFTYSFHQTVLKRAVNELNYGNLAPLGTFAWYIPVMIASDITKGLIQGGGELPSHMKGMDAAQWIMRGGERAGVLGLGAIGVDAGHDIWSLGGPAVEQVMDAWGSPARNTAINAIPLHGLFAEALK